MQPKTSPPYGLESTASVVSYLAVQRAGLARALATGNPGRAAECQAEIETLEAWLVSQASDALTCAKCPAMPVLDAVALGFASGGYPTPEGVTTHAHRDPGPFGPWKVCAGRLTARKPTPEA